MRTRASQDLNSGLAGQRPELLLLSHGASLYSSPSCSGAISSQAQGQDKLLMFVDTPHILSFKSGGPAGSCWRSQIRLCWRGMEEQGGVGWDRVDLPGGRLTVMGSLSIRNPFRPFPLSISGYKWLFNGTTETPRGLLTVHDSPPFTVVGGGQAEAPNKVPPSGFSDPSPTWAPSFGTQPSHPSPPICPQIPSSFSALQGLLSSRPALSIFLPLGIDMYLSCPCFWGLQS